MMTLGVLFVLKLVTQGKGPIMDMYEVVRGGGYDHEVGYLKTASYGTPLEVLNSIGVMEGETATITYKPPAYIKSASQIEITQHVQDPILLEQGKDYFVDLAAQSLSVNYYTNSRGYNYVYVIVLRG